MSYDPDDLGLDLLRARALPECHACRKKSDGAMTINAEGKTTVLCGTHFDEWIHKRYTGPKISAAEFAKELREGRYKPCWEAQEEP